MTTTAPLTTATAPLATNTMSPNDTWATPNDTWANRDRESYLCSVCGRPSHPVDDPQCMPATKPIAEQLVWAFREIERLRAALVSAEESRSSLAFALMTLQARWRTVLACVRIDAHGGWVFHEDDPHDDEEVRRKFIAAIDAAATPRAESRHNSKETTT
jgi:hypothetical protein